MKKQLKAARDDRALVTVRRSRGWAETVGYVAAAGREWVAVVRVEDLSFQGVALVRSADVRGVSPVTAGRRSSRAYLAQQGLWPPAVPELLDLDSTVGLLVSAGSLSRTLGLDDERRAARRVATVDRVGATWCTGHEVRRSGRWKEAPARVRHGLLTRVTLWEPYVETLIQLADERQAAGF